MSMHCYEFNVHDPRGFWGSLRQSARTRREAELRCRLYLEVNQVVPVGSLDLPYRLDLSEVDGKPARGEQAEGELAEEARPEGQARLEAEEEPWRDDVT